MKHLVIGDVHAAPGQDFRRFRWLGRMVRALLSPGDRVIQVGDWFDFEGLCRHKTVKDRAKHRVKDEIEAGHAALAAYHDGLGGHRVDHYVTEGNHDTRLAKLADDSPWLEGLVDVWSEHRRWGWHVEPFDSPLRLDGVAYQHFLRNEQSPRAIGGVNAARRIVEVAGESITVGHSHFYRRHIHTTGTGKRMHGLVAGCYFEHDDDFAGRTNRKYWRGALLKHDVVDGDYRLEDWPIQAIQREWGG